MTTEKKTYIAYFEKKSTDTSFKSTDNEIFACNSLKEAKKLAQIYKRQMGFGKTYTTEVKAYKK